MSATGVACMICRDDVAVVMCPYCKERKFLCSDCYPQHVRLGHPDTTAGKAYNIPFKFNITVEDHQNERPSRFMSDSGWLDEKLARIASGVATPLPVGTKPAKDCNHRGFRQKDPKIGFWCGNCGKRLPGGHSKRHDKKVISDKIREMFTK